MRGRSLVAFVGREQELATVEAVLDAAVGGRGQLLAVIGPAGIGKTALLLEAADRARARGMTVAWAGCSPDPVAPPLFPWAQLLRAIARDRPDADRSGANADQPDAMHPAREGLGGDPALARQARFAALVEHLHRAAADRPLVLVIDDLHWADSASLRLLGVLAPTLPGGPLAVLTAHRPDEEQALRQALPHLDSHGRSVHLPGLAVEEVADLAAAEAGRTLPERTCITVHRHTAGNPLFVRELVDLLARDDQIVRMGRPYATVPLPEGVRAVLDGQLQRTSPGCLRLLTTASVLGDEFDVPLLATVLEAVPLDLLPDADEAVAAGMVRHDGPGRFAFVHALIREAALGRLTSGERIRLHERAGRGLLAMAATGRTVDAAVLARHFLEAAPAGTGGEAVRYGRAAAAQAMGLLAYEDAVELYRLALDALQLAPGTADRAELLLGLGDAQQAVGNLDAARDSYEQTVALARVEGRPDLLARAALGMGSGTSGFEVPLLDHGQMAALEEAGRALGDAPSSLRVWVDARRSVASTYADTVAGRRTLSEQALAMARTLGDPAALGAALAAHCDAIAGPGDVEQRQREAGEIVALGVAHGDRGLELLGRRLRVLAAMEDGDIGSALTEVEAYAAVADRLGQPLYRWYVPLWRGAHALMHGRAADWERHITATEEIGDRAHSGNARILAVTQRWAAAMTWGRWDDARSMLDRINAGFAGPSLTSRLGTAYERASAGHAAEAIAQMDALTPDDLAALPVDAEWLTLLCYLGEAIVLVGGHALADQTYDLLLPHAERWAIDGIWAAAYGPTHRFLAGLAAVRDQPDAARAHADRAVELTRRSGAALLVAEAHLAAGRACPGTDHLVTARDLFASLDLPRRVDQVTTLLEQPPDRPRSLATRPADRGRLHLQGGVWEVGYAGRVVRLRDAKAMHDLACLLARPHTEVHVLQLAASPGPAAAMRGSPGDPDVFGRPGDLGAILDPEAQRAYRRRLEDLEEELAEAERFADPERAARAREEREALARELAAAVGLGGRARRTGDPAERARSAVTHRIRQMVTRIEELHPPLGRHLRHAVRTGTYCAYEPDEATTWEIDLLTT